MCGVHVKIVFQLLICHDTGQILRQCACQIIIDIRMCVTIDRREQDQDKRCHKPFVMSGDPSGDPSQIRQDRAVFCLLYRFIKYKDHRRQNRDTSDHAEYNALCHDDSQIHAQRETHKTQRNESGNCRDGASHNGSDRACDRSCHRFFVVIRPCTLILIAVPQENGVVHGDTELEYCRQGLRHIRDFSLDHVCSQIVNDRHSNTQKEKYRNDRRIHCQ